MTELGMHPRQEAVVRVCFALEPSEEDLRLLGARERWLLYRSMVRNRLHETLEHGLSRTAELMGTPAFEAAFDRWLDAEAPRTRYLREIVPAFGRWALPGWAEDTSLPPWTCDLARYEMARWEAWWLEGPSRPAGEIAFEKRPMVNPAMRVLRLGFPVHEKRGDREPYDPEPVNLAVYRTALDTVDVWVLNDVATDLLEAWQPGDRTITDTVREVAQRRGIEIDEGFIEKLSDVMTRFLEKGILLGSFS